jgi:hypothetical protein
MSHESWFLDGELNTDSPDHENSSYEVVRVECTQTYTHPYSCNNVVIFMFRPYSPRDGALGILWIRGRVDP